jgi:hypothetical protein
MVLASLKQVVARQAQEIEDLQRKLKESSPQSNDVRVLLACGTVR